MKLEIGAQIPATRTLTKAASIMARIYGLQTHLTCAPMLTNEKIFKQRRWLILDILQSLV